MLINLWRELYLNHFVRGVVEHLHHQPVRRPRQPAHRADRQLVHLQQHPPKVSRNPSRRRPPLEEAPASNGGRAQCGCTSRSLNMGIWTSTEGKAAEPSSGSSSGMGSQR